MWENELKESISTVAQLREFIKLTPAEEKQLEEIIQIHPMRISRYYMSLIDKNDPNDPLRRMIVPSEGEFDQTGSYDTSGEMENTKLPGLQHKYAETAFILSTNRCASYCRYCFRKRLVGLPTEEILQRFSDAVAYIEKHKEINNVLISGGDPFVLPTQVLAEFLEMLTPIPHLDFIRFGTKVPVTLPDRILEDGELLSLLKNNSHKQRRIYIVTQFNHPREISNKAIDAVDTLLRHNLIINNQTVLLRGVNDSPEILTELQNKLISIGINPYYVFQCRPVKRVKNRFQVPLAEGYEIVENAKKKLNGHSKRFKYVMSHRNGKIEIVGIMNGYIYFKYHQGKNPADIGKFFKRKSIETAGWLDDLE